MFVLSTAHLTAGKDWYKDVPAVLIGNTATPLPPAIIRLAKHWYRQLNALWTFIPKKIRDPYWVNNELKGRRGDFKFYEILLKTSDGQEISFLYLDRGKATVIVVGPGFGNAGEYMIPFVDMFLDFDIAIINFRGLGIHTSWGYNPFNWLLKYFLEVTTDVGLGTKEERDVFAVVKYLRKELGYDRVNGLGICLGGYVLLKSQALRENANKKSAKTKKEELFDSLIVDGVPKSIETIIERGVHDPKLLFDPQNGGWKNNWTGFLKRFIPWISKVAAKVDTSNTSIIPYLRMIKKTPILFFYSGTKDLLVTQEEFEEIWQAIQTSEKTGIFTDKKHVRNHLGRTKEIYGMVANLFFTLENNNYLFQKCLTNPQLLKKTYSDLQHKESLAVLRGTIVSKHHKVPKTEKVPRPLIKPSMITNALKLGVPLGMSALGYYLWMQQENPSYFCS